MRLDVSKAALVLSALSFASCCLAALTLAFPFAEASPLSGLAPAREARAYALSAASDATPSALERAAVETRGSLREAPANPTAWLRLAYLDSRDGDGLGPAGNLALARSYAVAPFGPDDTPWRLAFAFNHWTALSGSNRRLVLEELRWAQRHGRLRAPALRQSVGDPAGRLAVDLTLDVERTSRPSP